MEELSRPMARRSVCEIDTDYQSAKRAGLPHRPQGANHSPIGDDEHGTYTARPEYYGMMVFAQASGGERVDWSCKAGSLNFSSFAVRKDRQVKVTLVNNSGISLGD